MTLSYRLYIGQVRRLRPRPSLVSMKNNLFVQDRFNGIPIHEKIDLPSLCSFASFSFHIC